MRINGFLSSTRLCQVFVFALLLSTVGCGLPNGYVLNRSGIRQYKRGHYVQARDRFARALRHDPCNPDYRHNLAMALQKQGDIAGCEQILRHNLTVDAMHQPTYHSLAQLMVAQGRAPEAQELVSSWAATQPYVPESNIELAYLQQENGDAAGAEQSLQTALRADPANPTALAHLGQLYHGSGRTDQAVAYYQRSLASNWNQPEVQSRLATLVEPRRMSRSAMMQNDAAPQMIAGGPMMSDPMMASGQMMGDPMMASVPMMTSANYMSASYSASGVESGGMYYGDESSDSNGRHHRRRRRSRDNNGITASYPVPAFGDTATGWVPTSTANAYQMPPLATQPMLLPSQTADSMSTPYYASYSNGPTPIAQADPAHADDSGPDLAALPVVAPH